MDAFDKITDEYRRDQETLRQNQQAARQAKRAREHLNTAIAVGMTAFGVVLTIVGLGFVTDWAFRVSPVLGYVMTAFDFGLVSGTLYYVVEV